MNTPTPKSSMPPKPAPPNMPPGWAAMRDAFPPEIRDPWEAAYQRAFPGNQEQYKDDITWNYFQVLRLQAAMQLHANLVTQQQTESTKELVPVIKEATLEHRLNRTASDRSSLNLHQAAEVIRNAEVTRLKAEEIRRDAATPWSKLFWCAVLWSAMTLTGQYFVASMGTTAAIHDYQRQYAAAHRSAVSPPQADHRIPRPAAE